MTQQQFLSLIVVFAVILLVLVFAKKIVKFILTTVLIVCLAIYIGFITPTKLKNTKDVLNKATSLSKIENIANSSNLVRLTDNYSSVEVLVEDKWVNIEEITGVLRSSGDTCKFKYNDKIYEIKDKNLVSLFSIYSNN